MWYNKKMEGKDRERTLLELLRRCEHYVFFGSGQGDVEVAPKRFAIPAERRELMHELTRILHPEENA